MLIFHPTQSQVAKDRHRFRVLLAGRRWGKSTLAVYEMIGAAVAKADSSVCYLAPTYQQARDIVWVSLKRAALAVTADANESRLELSVRAKGGGTSRIALRGFEAVETLRGQRFDFLVADEVASMRNWWLSWQEVLRPTLTDTAGEALFISTPKGFNHFYDLYNVERKDKDFKSFHFTSYDNPLLDREEIEKAKSELTEDRFVQEYLADFRKTEGLVYKEFDRGLHVFDDLTLVKTRVETVAGIDWGYTNPTAVLTVVRDHDANFWVVGEWYKRGKTTDEIAEYAVSLRANAYYPDPAEPDRIRVLVDKGCNVREVSKDVAAGIDSVRSLFKNRTLHIHSSCENLIAELETYSYRDKPKAGNEPEEPLKENDHALDALRYCLFMQASRVRWERPQAARQLDYAQRELERDLGRRRKGNLDRM